MTIELRVSAPRPSFVAGENITLAIEIENRGPASVTVPDPEANANWQPTYELRGPGPNDVARFDLRTSVRKLSPAPQGPSDASLIEIQPGATWSGRLTLSNVAPVRRPGSYTLSARLTWGAIDVMSAPIGFAVEPLSAAAVDVGLSAIGRDAPEIYAVWRHEHGGRSSLFQGIFVEERPDLGEVARRAVVRIGDCGPGASRVLVPWGAHSRMADLIGWVLWLEGQDLCGQPTLGRGALRMPLPFAPACWALPVLESRGHDIDLFFVGGPAGRTLAMVRVKYGGFARPPAGSVLWTVELPEPVIGAAVSAPLGAYDKTRHLALVSADAGRVTVRHAMTDAATPPPRFAEITLDDCVASPGTPPAILAHDRGGARVTVLTASPSDPARCRLVELLFGAPHPAEPSAMSSSIALPAAPVEGQIRYHRHPASGAFRRDWALRGADGATYGRGPTGQVERVRPAEEDPPPLALLVLGGTSYLLERSGGAFGFEHV